MRVLKEDTYFELRRVRSIHGRRYLLKLPAADHQSAREELLVREFALFKTLRCDQCVAPVELSRIGESKGAYYEDFDGEPLHSAENGGFPGVPEFAGILARICAAITAFHKNGQAVVGLSPSSFLCTADRSDLKLVDAPLAQRIGSPIDVGAGRWIDSPYLPYVAPELVSGVPGTLSTAADLYALGVLLYEIICEHRPFDSRDPAELIQAHLAKRPLSPIERGARVPPGVSAVVMRLLSKHPQDRYDGISSFERDIWTYIDSNAAEVVARAPVDSVHTLVRPTLSRRLYGRTDALDVVRERLGASWATPRLVLVEAAAGMGKTTFAREAQRLPGSCHVAWGRFHPAAPVSPLGGWALVLVDLARFVLMRSGAEVDAMRARVLGALGDSAGLIAALAWEWSIVLGSTPITPPEPLETGLNRLGTAIRSLLGCFAAPGSPLLIVLDDLQWADSSSLRILEMVLTFPDGPNLVVIGTLRTDEPGSPESTAITALRAVVAAAPTVCTTLTLQTWSERELSHFLFDTLGPSLHDVAELAHSIHGRTDGNPLFAAELLRSLVEQGVLSYDVGAQRWQWQKAALRSFPVAGDVASLLARRIQAFPSETKDLLRMGACLGISFTLADLCAVTRLEPALAEGMLQPALRAGLLFEDEETEATQASGNTSASSSRSPQYEFIHDRVLSACVHLMSPTERAEQALHVARTLTQKSAADHLDWKPVRLATYYNLARELVTDDGERFEAAGLNLKAGRGTRRRGAFSQALGYFRAGLSFLESTAGSHEAAWKERPDLARALHEEAAECALLDGQLELAHQLCNTLLARLRAPLERVLAYEVRITALKAEKRFPTAVLAALEILDELGVRFPKKPAQAHALLGFVSTKRAVFAEPVSRLRSLPEMKDLRAKAVSRVIQSVYAAAYLGRPDLFPLLVYKHVNDSLRYGNEDYSATTYTAFAIVLAGLGEFERAAQLGSVALHLLDRFHAERLRAAAMMGFYTFVFPWRNHARDALPHLEAGLTVGLREGDFEYSSYIITVRSMIRLHTGAPLPELQTEFEEHRANIAAYRQERSILLQALFSQVVQDLRCPERGERFLAGPLYDEATGLRRCLEPLDENQVFHHSLAKLTLATFLADPTAAKDACALGRRHLQAGAFGLFLLATFTFYEALALLTAAPRLSGIARLRVVNAARRLQKWSASAPMNFLHKYHLVEAERNRLANRHLQASEHYERAIELSNQHGYLHELALCQERAALYYFERGLPRLGRQYLRDSYTSYVRWGATAVTRRLEREHPQQFALMASGPEQSPTGGRRFGEGLDYLMLLKSSQAISGEMFLPRLLERLLKTTLEHAAAQRGVLILERRGRLFLEAEADVDSGPAALTRPEPLEDADTLCRAIVRYVARTERPVILADAAREGLFVNDDYVVNHQLKSVMCTPILYQGRLLGIAYLENNRVSHVFTDARLEIVNLLAGQAAISIAIARFHALQIEAHQAKINPHFLFNALSSIADLALIDGKRAETALVKLARLYRYILTTAADDLVSLERELEIVSSYLELEGLRYGSKLIYSVTSDPDLAQVRLPGLLIQPLVENSVRHGVSHKLTPGHVSVSVKAVGDRCSIVVRDDGDGAKHPSPGTGFGLKSVQERLLLAYKQDYSLAITEAGGYRVEIQIPVRASPATDLD
jgi:predicted ATPase/GAF domain-containing protein